MNFLRFLTDGRWFLSMFMLSFAEGAAALGGGDGAAAAVIAGTGAEGEQGEGAEATTVEGVEPGAEGEPLEGAPEGEAEKPVVTAAQQNDGRNVPAAVRKYLAQLKATGKPEDAAVAKQINDAVWGYSALKADIAKNFGPEGLKEAIALKATVEELTGAASVEQFREEVQELRGLDQQFINGDPEFIKTAAAKFPDGFKKLAPAMVNMWATVDPDASDRYMAGIIVASLGQNQFGNNEARAIDFLEMKDPDKTDPVIQKAIALLTENQKSLSSWDKFSKSKPEAPAVDPNAAANAKTKAELDQREAKIFANGVTKDLDVFSGNKITSELTQLKKNVPESARPVFDKQVIDQVWVKMRSEPNFAPKFKALMANKDHAGVLKFLQSRSDAHYADAVDQVYKRLYGTTKFAGQKKPVPAVGAKPGAPGAAGQKPAVGWVKVAANVDPSRIDRKRTTERMIVIEKRAYMKDGKQEYWGNKIPT